MRTDVRSPRRRRGSPTVRRQEIVHAVDQINDTDAIPLPVICVVPVRMMEAWLLFDEGAIREAAGNPRGRELLALPRLREVENLPDPKSTLHQLLREASGLRERRRRLLRVHSAVHRIADITANFTPLRELPAFRNLELDLRNAIHSNGWNLP
jgi:hypothetical protein